ncbi:MAG: hypothetical protein KAR38_14440, partial [Calditrichia bacterium]|nr:hypothetical protein [Calditrichia bacterium]
EIQRNLAKEQGQLQELEKENLVDKQRLEMLNREIDRSKQELATTRIRIEGINNFIESNQPRLKELEDDELRIQAQFEEVKQEKLELTSKLESHKEQLHNKEKNSRELFQKISHFQEEINQKKFQIESKTEEKEKLEAQIKIIKESQENKANEFSGLEEKTDVISNSLNALEEENGKIVAEKENKEKNLQENKDKLNQLEKTLSNLEKEIKIYQNILESYEGYSSAIQYVMQNLSQNGDILDTLPNLFSVDDDIQEELSHFLAELADIVVVKDLDVAESVLKDVQNNKRGSLSIVPAMELDSGQPAGQKIDAEPLLNFIQAAPEHEKIVKNLFNNVYRTSSLKKAIELHKQYPYYTFIAPNGYTMGSFIQIKGGSKNSSLTNLIGRKNYIEKLKAEHAKVELQHKSVISVIEKTENELSEINDKLLSLEKDLKEKRLEFEIISRELQKNEIERKNINEKLEEAQNSINEHETLIAQWEEKLASLKPELESLNFEYDNGEDELEGLRKDTEYVENDLKKTSDDYNRLNLELVQIRNQYQSLDSDLTRNKGTLTELEKKREELEQEGLKQNDESISKLEIKIKERMEILHDMMTVFGEKEKKKNEKEEIYQEHKNQLLMVEEEIFKSRRNWNQSQERIKELEFKIQEHELKANGIQEQLMEYFKYEITEEMNFDDFNPERNKVDIEEINNKLLKIGEVNLLAIDEHKKEKERYEFLKEQEADILEAEEQLLETIDELNKTAIEKFDVTYEAIRVNFQKVFKEFFSQGDADLELIDRNDPLESDINIKVTPKGRKLQTLTLMSAGEKTLTAISLLFAIYLVKPSPFCILDEVDAPLDDVNIGRYTGALDNFSENTQFIVVTHNKKTMEKMDSIYGITMEQEGVSKVVSVKFD